MKEKHNRFQNQNMGTIVTQPKLRRIDLKGKPSYQVFTAALAGLSTKLLPQISADQFSITYSEHNAGDAEDDRDETRVINGEIIRVNWLRLVWLGRRRLTGIIAGRRHRCRSVFFLGSLASWISSLHIRITLGRNNKKRLYDGDLGELQELGIIEENYDKLKGLKRDMGEEVYKAVTTAFTEINDYNPRYVFPGSTLSDLVLRFNNIPQVKSHAMLEYQCPQLSKKDWALVMLFLFCGSSVVLPATAHILLRLVKAEFCSSKYLGKS
ncbi:hypothetical protein Ccrd_023286 [Cynara cardunculus var. scolymus]|uniref:Factor of DNA methylation 1-5/IDN2 domain-containing protein n=1 Tax=Cynara cardunculus var. scolymus TaxID=59895 RepID=A0A118JYW3_CYNCS|nr:hypothetical protein Ccrd_023286 [Cynara cardunculus var. scolymus]